MDGNPKDSKSVRESRPDLIPGPRISSTTKRDDAMIIITAQPGDENWTWFSESSGSRQVTVADWHSIDILVDNRSRRWVASYSGLDGWVKATQRVLGVCRLHVVATSDACKIDHVSIHNNINAGDKKRTGNTQTKVLIYEPNVTVVKDSQVNEPQMQLCIIDLSITSLYQYRVMCRLLEINDQCLFRPF